MGTELRVFYDSEGDIFVAERTPPYQEQVTRAIGDGILVRENPKTSAIESLEIWNFARRSSTDEGFQLPVEAEFFLPKSVRRLAV